MARRRVTKFHRRLTGGEPNVRAAKSDVPEALAAIVDRAVALDPNHRMATAEEFADNIEAYLEMLPNQPSEKSLAQLLVGHFAEERERLRKRIEAQLQRIQAQDQLSEPLRSGARRLDSNLTMSSILDLRGVGSAPGTRAERPTSLDAATAKTRGANWRRAVVATAGLLCAVAAASSLAGGRDSTPHAMVRNTHPRTAMMPVVQSGPSTPAAPAQLVAERSVGLTLEVSPSTAHVTLDGVSLPQLPFVASFPSSTDTHLLEASAQGFQSERQLVVFARDQVVKIELRPSVSQPHVRARRPVPAALVDAPAAVPATSVPQVAGPRADEAEPGAELKTRPRHWDFDMADPYAE